MAHFAQLSNENKVLRVIVIANEDCGGGEFPESESVGQDFIRSLNIEGTWLQTSYNANFRGVYAGEGFLYDEVNDIFIPIEE